MGERGVDLSRHRSRRLSLELIGLADLVLGMENRHVRAVAELSESALERTFTLKDFLRRCLTAGPRATGEKVADCIARLGQGRDLARLEEDDPEEAMRGPDGRARADFECCAEELELLVRGLHYFLWDATGPAAPQTMSMPSRHLTAG